LITKKIKHMENKETKKDPQNVWLKRLGLFILIAGMWPELMNTHHALMEKLLYIILVMSGVTYILINVVSYFKSLK
jgi:hypothetical protein